MRNAALVTFIICFGLGQQANAQQQPRSDTGDAVVINGATNLPDSPKPKQGGTPRASAFRADFDSDPFQPIVGTTSWGRAMLKPSVLIPSASLAGLTAIQLVKTDRCVNENKPACNVVFGKNRAAAYGVNIPLTAAIIWFAARDRQRGTGTAGLVIESLAIIGQFPVAYTANPGVLVCKPGRIPECQ